MRSATTAYTRPLDIRHGHVDLGHGAGGRSMNQLIADLFVRAFDNPALARKVYPFYEEFRGRMKLFGSMQHDSYRHPKAARSPGDNDPYWSMEDLFVYARDRLHVDYMFWVRIPTDPVAGAYNWYDALPVIEANPVF